MEIHCSLLKRPLWLATLMLIMAQALVSEAFSAKDTKPSDEVGEVFVLSLGGKLYDNYFIMTEKLSPETKNPDYPDYVPAGDMGTWRCVACHGWDYMGAKGERGKLAATAAFTSLRGLEGMELPIVLDRLKIAHPDVVKTKLSDQAPEILAIFLSSGQFDRSEVLDDNGKSKGSAPAGKMIFEGACMGCHQIDGRAYLRGEQGDKPSLGWVARNRPEQVIHKIMNGFPGSDMLAMRFLDISHVADLLAYLQTLDPGQQ